MRLRNRSAGDHNHEGPDAENPEPGDTPEVIRDRAYTWQAGEALRLRYNERSAAERVNGGLKDFGGAT
jgi:hypothetical protein